MRLILLCTLVLWLAGVGGCLHSRQYYWNVDMQLVPTGVPAEPMLGRLGRPDMAMGMEDFVARIGQTPGEYVDALAGTIKQFDSYKDYALFKMWLWQVGWDEAPRLAYDPAWYKSPQYQSLDLWVYDETVRYQHPAPGAGPFSCYVFEMKNGVCVGKFVLKQWDLAHFQYPAYVKRPDQNQK